THEASSEDYNAGLPLARAPIGTLPSRIEESQPAMDRWAAFVRERFMPADASLKARLYRRLPQPLRTRWRRLKTRGGPSPQPLAFQPVSRAFGFDRGTPIDRLYIERFLQANSAHITGRVMEVGDDRYTIRFGHAPLEPIVLVHGGDRRPNGRAGDLTRPETLPDQELDAFICTQVLNFIPDPRAAIRGLHAALRPGGTALVTVAGLSQRSRHDADRWGDYWRFMPQGIERLFSEAFRPGRFDAIAYGNSYAAACLMKGFAAEECDERLLFEPDSDYPVVIAIKATKG
ncbi:MAG: class I SAM-dependent methyltransferase, partial [Flavobacteriales bacterium]